ncbi:hypothetical protein MBLNU459_g1098t1 [Dothideomycetes sp. NU459]
MTSMPYNTRRKSLSLSELGIQVPKRGRAPSQSQLPPLATTTTTTADEPLTKKPKRSHGSITPPSSSMSPPRTTNIHVKAEPPSRLAEHTPPPSPGSATVSKIDTEGISDDVVVGTIKQLEATGNRPHLVKELAAVLCHNIAAVEKSANPANLISSRLTSYLNRTWPTISPCPLAKYQSTVHPRPLYYFLTTCPHQPISEMIHSQSILNARRVISPSLSSAADEEETEAKYNRARDHMSPSPEVDLSSPELDDDDSADSVMSSSFTGRGSIPREHPPTSSNLAHNRRADSPPLEREERDFKQTANQLQELRRTSQDNAVEAPQIKSEDTDSVAMSIENETDETEESMALRNSEAVATLFGGHGSLSTSVSTIYDFSSPIIKPVNLPNIDAKTSQGMMLASAWHGNKRDLDAMSLDHDKDDDAMDTWVWADADPENIELDELECLFDAY